MSTPTDVSITRLACQKITDWRGDEHRALVAIHDRLTRSLADLGRFMLSRAAAGEGSRVAKNVRDYRAFLWQEMVDLEESVADVALAAGKRGAR